jgi:threonine synthase
MCPGCNGKEIMECIGDFARNEGVFLSPEGGAVFAAFKKLCSEVIIKPKAKVVLINTGSPYKYTENLI